MSNPDSIPFVQPVIRRISDALTTFLAVLVLLMMAAIVLQVIVSRLGLNTIVAWEPSVFLFGRGITLNSLIELHWYLLAAIVLLPIAQMWAEDTHIRVDFIYGAVGDRSRAAIDLVGNCLFTLPFLVMCIPAAWKMTLIAFGRGERSQDDGLLDRFLVKGMIPVAFAMLLIVVLAQLPSLIRRLRAGSRAS